MRRLAVILLLLTGGGFALIGCPAAHDDYPGLACKVDSDCYGAETCVNLVCTPPDLSIPGDLSFPRFDFSHTDIMMDDGDTPMPDLSSGGDM
jgi:hypothetical protein